MLFELDADQQAIVDAVHRIVTTRAGPARARELGGVVPRYDHELAAVLTDEGYMGFEYAEGAGPLEAALVVEAVAGACGVVAIGAAGLVVPGALQDVVAGPVALTTSKSSGSALAEPGLVRYAADAAAAIVVGDEDVTIVDLGPGDTERVPARYGFPMGRITRHDGRVVRGVASRVQTWWRLAIAAEISGIARAAIDVTTAHLRDREQFGRPLGSFQGVQHRLAECEVLAHGARWLTMEAAWSGANPERVAAAITESLRAAQRVFADTHQFSGALGFTEEYDLHLSTMRLPALRAEAAALGSAPAALSAARWGAGG